jgi:hypothetical protein
MLFRLLGLAAMIALAGTSIARAQKISGKPGSPSATMTIDGRQLPPPPLKFGGKIERNALQSKPWWPPRVVPPKGAPNVLLIMTDDVGFGAPSTFGGVIPTPALGRVAANGLRYTNFHSTALCSATCATGSRGGRGRRNPISPPGIASSHSIARQARHRLICSFVDQSWAWDSFSRRSQ